MGSSRKQIAKARLQALADAEQEVVRQDAEKSTVFTPEALKTDLMRTLELEEMAKRVEQRGQRIPEFYAGSTLSVTFNEEGSRPRVVKGICIAKVMAISSCCLLWTLSCGSSRCVTCR